MKHTPPGVRSPPPGFGASKVILTPDFVHERDDVLLERCPAELALDLENPSIEQLVQDAVHDQSLILRSGRDDVDQELIEVDPTFVDHVHSAEMRQRLRRQMEDDAIDEVVDVIADFQATNYPGSDGLGLEEVREALELFARQKHLAAIELTAYNPTKDPDGGGAKLILDLLAGALGSRLKALREAAPATEVHVGVAGADAQASGGGSVIDPGAPRTRPVEPGEALSPEEPEEHSESAGATPAAGPPDASADPEHSDS